MTDQSLDIAPVARDVSRAGRVLQGKTAIVTGAGTGIGRGIARLFASEGASILVADRNAVVRSEARSPRPSTMIIVDR